MRAQVHGGVGDLAAGLRVVASETKRRMPGVVREAAKRGNRHAREFASEQHTMFSDVDIDYPPSFTVERIGPTTYEYGPEDSGEGRKSPGYEHGSINQAYPHRNLDRSVDIEAIEFPMDVSDEMRHIWQEGGF